MYTCSLVWPIFILLLLITTQRVDDAANARIDSILSMEKYQVQLQVALLLEWRLKINLETRV